MTTRNCGGIPADECYRCRDGTKLDSALGVYTALAAAEARVRELERQRDAAREALREGVRILRDVPRSLRNIPEVADKWQAASDVLRGHWTDECERMAAEVKAFAEAAARALSAKEPT